MRFTIKHSVEDISRNDALRDQSRKNFDGRPQMLFVIPRKISRKVDLFCDRRARCR